MTIDKRRAIRNQLARQGMQARPREVVEALESFGILVSERLVTHVKSQIIRDGARAERQRTKRAPRAVNCKRPRQQKIPPRR